VANKKKQAFLYYSRTQTQSEQPWVMEIKQSLWLCVCVIFISASFATAVVW